MKYIVILVCLGLIKIQNLFAQDPKLVDLFLFKLSSLWNSNEIHWGFTEIQSCLVVMIFIQLR